MSYQSLEVTYLFIVNMKVSFRLLVVFSCCRFPSGDLVSIFIIFLDNSVNKGIHLDGMILIFTVLMQNAFSLALFLSNPSRLTSLLSVIFMKTHITASKQHNNIIAMMVQLIIIIEQIQMIDLSAFPTQQLHSNRSLFKKGEFYESFYFLLSGTVKISISQITIEVSSSIFIGDFEILSDIQYRLSTIKTITKCSIIIIPKHLYNKIHHYHTQFDNTFNKFYLKNKFLRYWLKKLFVIKRLNKNEEVGQSDEIGVIIEGQFKIDRKIPIIMMKQRNLQLLRKFQICIIGQQELFKGRIICETHIGIVAVMDPKYITQLTQQFDEFSLIIGVTEFKQEMHHCLTKDIANNCRKKKHLFKNMVPLTLKDYVKNQEPSKQATPRHILISPKHTEDVFSVKDNISQFLHKQWRKGLSMKLPRQERGSLNFSASKQLSKEKHSKNPELISLSIPKQFKDEKFKMKMLLKARDPYGTRRLKTESNEPPRLKLIFH